MQNSKFPPRIDRKLGIIILLLVIGALGIGYFISGCGTTTSTVGGGTTATGNLAGSVTSETTGSGINNASVQVGSYSATSASNGAYSILNITAGTYTATASAVGYLSTSEAVTITSGNNLLNFSLSPIAATLASISATSDSTAAAAGGTIQFSATAHYSDSSSTDATANVTWHSTNTTVGTIDVLGLFYARSAGTTWVYSTYISKTSNTIEVAVNPSASTYNISGTIECQLGGLSGITINLSGTATVVASSVANGEFLFSGLNPGVYYLTPSAQGFVFSPASAEVTLESTSLSAPSIRGALNSVNYRITFNTDNGSGSTDIWRMNLDGSGRTQLTSNGLSVQPKFSSGKSKIAYIVLTSNFTTWEIYSMNANGSSKTNLTNNGRANTEQAWASNNDKLLYASSPGGTTLEIYSMNADGSGQTRLTNYNCDTWGPVVFSTGTECIFHTNYNRASGYDIYKMNIDGTNPTNLTSGLTTSNHHPSVSGDCSKIAYGAFDAIDSTKSDVYVIAVDGTNRVNVSASPSNQNRYPSLSYDGAKVVFESNRTGAMEVYIANTDGSGLSRLTTSTNSNASYTNYKPQFLRDGQILFISKRDGKAQIYVMNLDGSSQTRISDTTTNDNQELADWDKPSF